MWGMVVAMPYIFVESGSDIIKFINNWKIVCEVVYMVEKNIRNIFLEYPEVIYGFTSIAYSEYKVKYYIPPVAQNNEIDLTAPFSFKFAAVNAGLGWIGKNDVVITEKYGPRVRLSVILINEKFVYGNKILKSNCPENCKKCVDVCPHKALHDEQWNINSLRSDIIDYQLCNEKRSIYIKTHGRKNACGLCMAVCPFGT